MKKPKVSIIIPVYNGSNYMKEAIDSALAQDYENLEIIVVNDGSIDDGKTHEIALSYGDKIKYFKKENGGVSTALNLAIEKMTGDYFSWLSHDDVYFPNKVSTQIKYLEDNNLLKENVILYADYELIDKNSKHISYAIKDSEMLNSKPEYSLLRGSINGLTLLIPKKAFKEHGIFDVTLRAVQDYELWYRMISTYKFIHVPGIIVKSRYHSKQVSNTSPKVKTEGNAFWLRMIQDLTKKDMERLELSEYNFYMEMSKFLKDTPYDEADKYCKEKIEKIRNNFKMKDSKVSIIIPVWNRVDVTIRAIKSVLNQTYKNIEIIIVNDASTIDLTKLKKFISKYKNIEYIDLKENGGPAKARNIGMEKATGEYVAFLDSDDEFVPEKIEKQLFEMQLYNSVMSHTSYILDKDNNKTIINSGIDNGYVNKKLMYSCQIATPTVMLKSEYLIKNKLSFNTTLRIGEDTCFWLTILKHVPLLGINEPLSIVHSSENNAAFSEKSQLEGSKNILRFLLNDEYYSKIDIGLYRVTEYYSSFVKKVNNINQSSDIYYLDHRNFFVRNTRKVVHYIQNEGLANTIERIKSKIKRKINEKRKN